MNETPLPSDADTAIQWLLGEHSTNSQLLKASNFLVQNRYYDYYPDVISKLQPLESAFAQNAEWHFCLGFAKVTHHQPDEAIDHLLKTISRLNNVADLYIALIWAYLQTDQWAEAFFSASTGLFHCQEKAKLQNLYQLSKLLFEGKRAIRFNKDSKEYQFSLFTSNTQEIEASITHLKQQFTESEELAMLSKHLQGVQSIAEIGCLVGNHSVFFLKHFPLKNLHIIDASETSLAHTRTNLEQNLDPAGGPEVQYTHSAIGASNGTVTFFNKEVPIHSVSDLLQEPYDFIKIDVDGYEIDTLEGARDYIQKHQPAIMIEIRHQHDPAFLQFISDIQYSVLDSVPHTNYTNYLIRPAP